MTGVPIFAALGIFDVLVLWLIVRTGGRWTVNVAAITITLGFNFVVWVAIGTYQGWPVRTSLPTNAIFIAAVIDEPSQVNNDPGHIDIWLVPANAHTGGLLGYKPSQGEPRAYRVAYSPAMESAVQNATNLQRGANGAPIAISLTRRRGKNKLNGTSIPKYAFRAYVLPPLGQSLKGATP